MRTNPYFEWEASSTGVKLRLIDKPLLRRANPIPVDAWADRMVDRAFAGVSRLITLLDDGDEGVERAAEELHLTHATVATLTEPQALGLGLPPSVRAVLQIDSKNHISDPNFSISYRWLGQANRALRSRRDGALLDVEGDIYRLPDPIFNLIEAIDAFGSTDTSVSDTRMARLAQVQALVPSSTQHQIAVDAYFSSFRILHASAFSLSLRIDRQSFDFDPVLFGRKVIEQARHGSSVISEAEGLLTDQQQETFAKLRFRSSDSAKPSYVIESGLYVYVDPSLCSALSVVRRMQKSDYTTSRLGAHNV